jgi:hypothetical protein
MSFTPEENFEPLASPATLAADRVSAPGILLIIVGALNFLGVLFEGYNVVDAAITPLKGFAERQELATDMMKKFFPQMADEIAKQPKQDPQSLKTQSMLFNGILLVILLALAIVPMLAGIRMRKLSGYGMAITGAILAMFPCSPGCCLIIGPVAGIWSLVVLFNADVKAAFR